MGHASSKTLFDKRDHMLLSIVNDVLKRDESRKHTKKIIYPYLHPHGIKEMAESRGLRIAHAVIHLLEYLEAEGVDDRLNALRTVRDELLDTAQGVMPKNTARVLLQIMKDLVRTHGNYDLQLQLAHDFRAAAAGKPRIIRKQMKKHHLLEMPEDWNQITFDNHVHDANTKGRKSSSHLIMDAWIKGIRRLRVVYYNYLEPKYAIELLEAAQIMEIDLRIGIEFSTRFRDRYAQVIWAPRGFTDSQDFLIFLAEESVMEFMAEGRKVSEYQRDYVLAILREFNKKHRYEIEKLYGLKLDALSESDFLSFVGTGQASLLHLAKFIHSSILPAMKAIMVELRNHYAKATDDEKHIIEHQVDAMNSLDLEKILEEYLLPEKNPHIPNPNLPRDSDDLPSLLKLSPQALIDRLTQIHPSYRITLNLSNLKSEDVLELLYDCEGRITRLEIFNLKDYASGQTEHIPEINDLQSAINHGNAIELKRIIRNVIARLETSDYPDRKDRIASLTNILYDISMLKEYYKSTPLKSRIGSDSTGRSPQSYGMGLAVTETLPPRAQKEIRRHSDLSHETIPVNIKAFRRTTYVPRPGSNNGMGVVYSLLHHIPFLREMGLTRCVDWLIQEYSISKEGPGDIVTLGGVQRGVTNRVHLFDENSKEETGKISWQYLNTGLKNILKAFIGFVPAFMTFMLTKDWWVLAYFGAFIWFGITGLRNVLQSVLGGGGIRRSRLIRWNDYVRWEQLADSLLFTGFSVPLLDFLVKTVILDRWWGITTATNPALLYTIMALVNGVYLSSHNALRDFPRTVIYGNLFRSVLSIPVAIVFNASIGAILSVGGFTGIDQILQKWAAIISKAASDCVAGVIEGMGDRYQNIRMRWRDYNTKFSQLYDVYSLLEIRFPESQVEELLEEPRRFSAIRSEEVRDLQKILIINALDLLYFWMYQPRARHALRATLRKLSDEERRILMTSQKVLLLEREITLLFADGLVGKNFSRALSFYLNYSRGYLDSMRKLMETI